MDRLQRAQDGVSLRSGHGRIVFLADCFMIDLVMREDTQGNDRAAVIAGLLLCVPRPYGRTRWLVGSSGPRRLLLSLDPISPGGRVSSVSTHADNKHTSMYRSNGTWPHSASSSSFILSAID